MEAQHTKNRRKTAYNCKREEKRCERKNYLFVAIAYGKSVVICEQFLGKNNSESYSKFFRKYFPATFVKANNSEGKLF